MPTFQLSCGVSQAIAQNEVWAMPTIAVYLSTSAALEGSFSPGGPWVAVPGSPGPTSVIVAVPYIRCPGGPATVIVKRF